MYTVNSYYVEKNLEQILISAEEHTGFFAEVPELNSAVVRAGHELSVVEASGCVHLGRVASKRMLETGRKERAC